MDNTAIQAGAAPTKPVDTNVQAGAPPVNASFSPEMQPHGKQKHVLVQVLEVMADLRITVTLFVLSIILVFWGTLAQTDAGVWTIVNNYFRSLLVWVPLKVVLFNSVEWPQPIPFPGGWLIGGVMLVNLLAAHAIRFKLAWNRAGIIMIHAGIILMMLGELITGLYAIEGSMVIPVGQGSNTIIHPGQTELAIIKTFPDDIKKDEVVTIPAHLLKNPGAVVEHPDVPFKVEVIEYMVNSTLKIKGNKHANRGFGKNHVAIAQPEVSGVDPNQKHDLPSVYVRLTGKDVDAGVWLFSAHYGDPQWVKVGDTKYQVILRFKQTTRPFNLHLTKFEHKVFPGTNTPKDFHSYVIINDKVDGQREVEIYMNTPLYYNGETYYQSSWTTDLATGKANGTVLQVVRNPGWVLPYLSCLIVGIGLLAHFGLILYRFVDRRIVR